MYGYYVVGGKTFVLTQRTETEKSGINVYVYLLYALHVATVVNRYQCKQNCVWIVERYYKLSIYRAFVLFLAFYNYLHLRRREFDSQLRVSINRAVLHTEHVSGA